MRILLAFIFAFTNTAYAANSSLQIREGQSFPGISYSRNFVKNPEFEKNKLNITDASTIATRNTTTPLQGAADLSIDASASGQLVKFDTATLENTLKGQNCEAKFVFTGDAVLYKTYVEQGATKVTTDLQLTSETNSKAVSINFPCGDLSSNSHLVVESTGAGASAIKVDQVYLGAATNIGSVAQAQFVGSAVYPGTSNCAWSSSSTSMAAFAADTDCSTPTLTSSSGVVSAPGTKIPGVVASNLSAGTYKVTAIGTVGKGGTVDASVSVAISDGTTILSPIVAYENTQNSAYSFPYTAVGFFTYAAAQSSVTFQVYGQSGSASNSVVLVNNATTTNINALTILIEKIPSGSEIAVRQNNTPWYVEAYINGANPSLGLSNVASDTEVVDAGLTMTPGAGSQPVGIMCSSTNAAAAPSTSATTCAAGSEGLGGSFNIPEAGGYEVCASFYSSTDVGAAANSVITQFFKLIETATNSQAAISGGSHSSVKGHYAVDGAQRTISSSYSNLCEIFNFSSVGVKSIRLKYLQSVSGTITGSAVGATSANGGNFKFTVKPVTRQAPAPLLVGSVTSNTSGMERVERATIASAGTISSQSGTWLSVGSKATGAYTWTSTGLSSGFVCMCNPSGNSTGKCIVDSYGTNTFRTVLRDSAGTLADTVHEILCLGPR